MESRRGNWPPAGYLELDPSGLDAKEFKCCLCSKPLWQDDIFVCILPLDDQDEEESAHETCRGCYERVRGICPTCSKPFAERDKALERLLAGVRGPCKFSHAGCVEWLPLREKSAHEAACSYDDSTSAAMQRRAPSM